MSGPGFAASILVLTEDSSRDALPTVRALAGSLLRLSEPTCQMRHVDLEPQDERAQQAMQANLWKGKNGPGHQKRVDLARTIATKILTRNGFVLVHIDADRQWGERDRRPSENLRRFRDEVAVQVERLVAHHLEKQRRQDELSAILSRLCVLAPHYSVESWLYQNTRVARELCHKHHGGRDTELFARWEQDRAALDEVERPKQATCLGARHNRALAEPSSFPASAIHAAGKSFAEATARMKACAALREALASTRPGIADRSGPA